MAAAKEKEEEEAAAGPLVQRYEGAARGRGVAAAGWRVCLAHRFEELRQPYGAADVPLRDVLRHVGLALRLFLHGVLGGCCLPSQFLRGLMMGQIVDCSVVQSLLV